ncbi:IS30 family transposase [Micromonospora tulbaghiae]|uniref:IS30 family transposase n=1 Tax=Micromonospora tulbaghiae TaxID=479978 RepID=UPI0023ED83AC|nr:IS30 family transposase [Micromonospora tulbaghiae]
MASRLSPLEREEIGLGRAAGESLRSIACRLGRSASTVSREVGRFERYGQRYQPSVAQWASFLRHNRARRVPRLAGDGPLRQVVLDMLRRRRSPQQIAARLRLEYPLQPEMHVSHETIYQAIYLQARGNLRAELTRQVALRCGRAARRRRPAAAAAVRSSRPWLGLNISARPAEVADRAVPGHWEGDLLEGTRRGTHGGSAIATLVERATRFVILVELPEGKVSAHVVSQLAAAMTWLPQRLRASLTWDQGPELARHRDFTIATDCPVYFCDPHSPWQRGSNENTNGLLRQYFPKGRFDFTTIDQAGLNTVADELNDRPRMTLGWATPGEKMAQLLGVATTG